MINTFMIEGIITSIKEEKKDLHTIEVINQYFKFETKFKIIIFKHILNENLEYYYHPGDKVIITNLSVYQKDNEMRFRFNSDSQMKVIEKVKSEEKADVAEDRKKSIEKNRTATVKINSNDFWDKDK